MCIWHTPQWRLESELTEGRVGEFGMDMCTLPCLKWITSEDPLCSSVLCVAWMVKGLVCVWLSPFTIHLNYHSTVNRLYPNTKKKKKIEKSALTYSVNFWIFLHVSFCFSGVWETGALPVCLLLGTHARLYLLTASRMTTCAIFMCVYIASRVSC